MEPGNASSASPYRWVVLLVLMFNVAITQILWLTFAPISRDVATVYTGGNVDYITGQRILLQPTLYAFMYRNRRS